MKTRTRVIALGSAIVASFASLAFAGTAHGDVTPGQVSVGICGGDVLIAKVTTTFAAGKVPFETISGTVLTDNHHQKLSGGCSGDWFGRFTQAASVSLKLSGTTFPSCTTTPNFNQTTPMRGTITWTDSVGDTGHPPTQLQAAISVLGPNSNGTHDTQGIPDVWDVGGIVTKATGGAANTLGATVSGDFWFDDVAKIPAGSNVSDAAYNPSWAWTGNAPLLCYGNTPAGVYNTNMEIGTGTAGGYPSRWNDVADGLTLTFGENAMNP
jgi:hypothetical protein